MGLNLYICLLIHNELTLHAAMMNPAIYRALELVGSGSFRNKFDYRLLTLLKLPTVTALRRRELETSEGRRVVALGNNRDFDAVFPVKRSNFELGLHSQLDMD